ncbi:MAG: flagellin [Phenylobacterium sp.]|uniref:flagellin n=1 Tax=Phenylobacterium sp. TaxID=1871053 RepID=UPI002732323E|nr:flagellin [Phenylobacterium sp.]MDP3117385.1 flagellin [Phenylobacterium sp.]MDP3384939.1 flagellin [Phenylobacterium sp.]
MVSRVSTGGNYSAVLANLISAQQRQMDAGTKVASQKNGSDLKDYARNAEMLTAMRSIETRLGAFTEQNKLVSDRLTTQDFALSQVADAAQIARQAIAESIASGRVDTLMQDIQAAFRNGVEGMNARYGGKYLFAGGQVDTPPFSATSLSDLTIPATNVADYFHNDSYVAQAKVDDSTLVNLGFLADAFGTGMMEAFKAIQAFEEGVNGPFDGELTDNQRIFLESQLSVWDTAYKDLVNVGGRNGMVQSRVDSVKEDLVARTNSIKGMVGEIVDADMSQAVSNLQQAQISVQAAAQVFLALQESSLLNVLR